jgi:glutamyl-tRNA synthetase
VYRFAAMTADEVFPHPCATARRTTGVTRLAPSPTGSLHLGNARTFLVNWALARNLGWEIVLRIEDLDGPRIKPEATQQALDDLAWLGIDYDRGPIIQTQDLTPYIEAMRTLAARGLAYPSELSRKEIEAAGSAPQEGTGEVRFPRELRGPVHPREFVDTATNWRLVVDPATITFDDRHKGVCSFDPSAIIGDFVIWTKRAVPSYQLAVVVDDARQGITEVVRGDDLLDSGARQLLLYRALGLTNEPRYTHLPLIIGPDGKRLAKRHGESKLSTYRAAGVPPQAIIGLLASYCGLLPPGSPRSMDAREFRAGFTLEALPRDTIVFTTEHERWLHAQATV